MALTRATREHPDVRMGSSVRGSIDLVLLLTGLAGLRGEDGMARDSARDAAHAALSGRIRIADGCDRAPESVIDELLDAIWPGDSPGPRLPDAAPADGAPAHPDGGRATLDGRGKGEGLPAAAGHSRAKPAGIGRQQVTASTSRRDRARGPARRTLSRAELGARHDAFAAVSPGLGQLGQQEFGRLLAADPDAAVLLLADLARATDRELRAAAGRLAARVFFRLARAGREPARGTRRLVPGRAEGDLDLDATLGRLSGPWPPDASELVTSAWQARRRSVCLLVDASGSMSGLAVAIAAMAAASLVLAADGTQTPGIAAFSGGVSVLQTAGRRRPPADLVGDLLALRGHGLTDLAAALRAGAAQLSGAPAAERVVILLSDCLPTAGGDPARALAGIDRLHVLCPRPAAAAEKAAEALARSGGGLSQPLRRVADVPAALTRALS